MRGPSCRSSAVWVFELVLLWVFALDLIVKRKRRISQIFILNLASDHVATLQNLGKMFNINMFVLDRRLHKRA